MIKVLHATYTGYFPVFLKNNDMRQIPEQRGMTSLLDSVDFEINDSAVEHIPFFHSRNIYLFLFHFYKMDAYSLCRLSKLSVGVNGQFTECFVFR